MIAGQQTTLYLHGLGPLGELTDAWAYPLIDGTNSPRQLTAQDGVKGGIKSPQNRVSKCPLFRKPKVQYNSLTFLEDRF